MNEEYSCDRHIVGRCFYCGHEFEYTIKKEFLKEHKNITMAIQLYCSQPCENASNQEFAKLRLEREAQKPKEREKYCPKCGYVPKPFSRQKFRKDCPKCATLYEWREV